jgi:hypothetical protein
VVTAPIRRGAPLAPPPLALVLRGAEFFRQVHRTT